MNKCINYIYSIGAAMGSLGKGMFRTFSSMVHPAWILTQQYPENRETTLYIPERFEAELHLIEDENGELALMVPEKKMPSGAEIC